MPARGQKTRVVVGDPNDPHGMPAMAAAFLDHLRLSNFSPATVHNHEVALAYLSVWCVERGIGRPREVTKAILERYQRFLYHWRKSNGQPLSFHTQAVRLYCIKMFFRWLARGNFILYNPASEIELPRGEKRIPRHVLSVAEAETILGQPDIATPRGVRDRAILETLYSTGMRRMELTRLAVFDLDFDRGTVLIRQGKGKKDRLIPIGERALAWIDKYSAEVRPLYVRLPDAGTLFLASTGASISPDILTTLVREYIAKAGFGNRGACHLFRHTMATLMLENGADVRYIQEMLGHAKLDSTQIYTQVSIRKLKEIHTVTHPSAKLEKRPARD